MLLKHAAIALTALVATGCATTGSVGPAASFPVVSGSASSGTTVQSVATAAVGERVIVDGKSYIIASRYDAASGRPCKQLLDQTTGAVSASCEVNGTWYLREPLAGVSAAMPANALALPGSLNTNTALDNTTLDNTTPSNRTPDNRTTVPQAMIQRAEPELTSADTDALTPGTIIPNSLTSDTLTGDSTDIPAITVEIPAAFDAGAMSAEVPEANPQPANQVVARSSTAQTQIIAAPEHEIKPDTVPDTDTKIAMVSATTPEATNTTSVPATAAPTSRAIAVNAKENLWRFAKRVTGNANTWTVIAAFNDMSDALRVQAGQVLNVPENLIPEHLKAASK